MTGEIALDIGLFLLFIAVMIVTIKFCWKMFLQMIRQIGRAIRDEDTKD